MTRHVLVVDDDPAIREVARMSLSAVGGWQVSDADGGLLGAEAARLDPPDAVLLDVMMPGTDGPATFALLRAQSASAHVPVVFFTAKPVAAERSRLEALGARGVIAKPFDPLALPGQMAALLGWA